MANTITQPLHPELLHLSSILETNGYYGIL